MKVDARPGGYVATGGHGGILGGMGYHGAAVLHYVPALKHTYLSEVNLSKMPSSVPVVYGSGGMIKRMDDEDQGRQRRSARRAPSRLSRSSRMAAFMPRNISTIPPSPPI